MLLSESNFTDEKLQECCAHGFSLIPMKRTCEERMHRVSLVETNRRCVDVFLECCREGERLRQKKMQEDAQKGLARSEIKLSCGHKILHTFTWITLSNFCNITKFNHKTLVWSFLAVSTADIEQFFMDTAAQYIRRFFPPSFAFTEFEVNGQKK